MADQANSLRMKFEFTPSFSDVQQTVRDCMTQFESGGTVLAAGRRNTIKIFEIGLLKVNIKSFKRPNLINKIAYRYFRKSKARRSFEYATRLLQMGIGTPTPIAFAEAYDVIGLSQSFYASHHLQCDLTFRELVENPNYPDRDNILRQFTRFSYLLHQKGVEFKDHSPGNTLIVKQDDAYDFYLVDLNRMAFHESIPFELRMKNLSRLTPHREMVRTMSDEYAKASGEDFERIFQSLWQYTQAFQYRFHRKKRLKKKWLFRS